MAGVPASAADNRVLAPMGSGESEVRRQMAAASGRIKRLKRIDRVAVAVITLGGIGVILSVIGILVFIGAEAVPLFRPASATLKGTLRAPDDVARASMDRWALGSDDFDRYVYTLGSDGRVIFLNRETGAPQLTFSPPSLAGATVLASSRSLLGNFVAASTTDGRIALLQIRFLPVHGDAGLTGVKVDVRERGTVEIDAQRRRAERVSYLEENGRKFVAGQVSPFELALLWVDETETERRALVTVASGRTITAVRVGGTGTAIAGTDRGEVYHWRLQEEATLTDVSPVSDSAVTALEYMIGNNTFIAGMADGRLSAWFRAPANVEGDYGMVRSADFEPQGARITAIAASTRDRTFATGDASGHVVVRHQTSNRTLTRIAGTTPVQNVVMTPKSDGLLVARAGGEIDRVAVGNAHPEASLHTLFGKVWYEGYAGPEYVWQSTGATDDFEPKMSLVPLVFGTIKGTFYALVFAIPLAVLGALYTSQFVHPSIRARIKPTIEIMAALPSVVIGFVAGLYLAPVVERNLVAIMLLVLALPIFGTSGFLIWNILPYALRRWVQVGAELLVIVPMLVIAGWLAFALAPSVEHWLFAGDARQWLSNTLGITYDQRNSLVVGLSMGFAVIPIIFTICEDAFSSVPSNLVAASLAMGASRWQTAIRVVLPTASPGVFSAVMVGFGRAVGETMIVLMATGNTPIMDWSMFNGFRTLSANIAVEIPEAPQGATLYRILFLSGALLFVLTFTLNTLAEIVRQRLRERYRAL
jgi:phosphate transport system permease protein